MNNSILKKTFTSGATFGILVGIGIVTSPTQAATLSASGDFATGIIGRAVGGANTSYSLLAHSNQTKPAPTPPGPNASSMDIDTTRVPPTSTLQPGDIITPAPPVAGSITVGGTITPPTPSNTYTPLVGFRNRMPKPATNSFQIVDSTTGDFTGQGRQGIIPTNPRPVILKGLGDRKKGSTAKGEAAGQAIDPFPLPADIYNYNPLIDILLQVDEVEDFAGTSFFAHDSRYMEPLWGLEVVLTEFQLFVSFESNDMARQQGVFVVDDNVIEENVETAITFTGKEASLSLYNLFGLSGQSYVVDSTITFSEEVRAGISTEVPESSSSLSLLAFGILGMGLTLKARMRPISESCNYDSGK